MNTHRGSGSCEIGPPEINKTYAKCAANYCHRCVGMPWVSIHRPTLVTMGGWRVQDPLQ